MNINDKLKKIIESTIEIKIEKNIEDIVLRKDLQVSSLEMLWIIIDIEKEFKIRIEEEDISKMYSGKDVIEYIKNKLSHSET